MHAGCWMQTTSHDFNTLIRASGYLELAGAIAYLMKSWRVLVSKRARV
jgi:hypothetical protein